MDIAVEISFYPLAADYTAPIKTFLERLNATQGLKVVTTSLSTQVFGPYEQVLEVLGREMRASFEAIGRAVFIVKFFGPL